MEAFSTIDAYSLDLDENFSLGGLQLTIVNEHGFSWTRLVIYELSRHLRQRKEATQPRYHHYMTYEEYSYLWSYR